MSVSFLSPVFHFTLFLPPAFFEGYSDAELPSCEVFAAGDIFAVYTPGGLLSALFSPFLRAMPFLRLSSQLSRVFFRWLSAKRFSVAFAMANSGFTASRFLRSFLREGYTGAFDIFAKDTRVSSAYSAFHFRT